MKPTELTLAERQELYDTRLEVQTLRKLRTRTDEEHAEVIKSLRVAHAQDIAARAAREADIIDRLRLAQKSNHHAELSEAKDTIKVLRRRLQNLSLLATRAKQIVGGKMEEILEGKCD